MNKIERFEDLQAWQAARELTRTIYHISRAGPLSKDYGLRDQLIRAALGIMIDVAEGFERFERADKVALWAQARGGCSQIRALTYVCEDHSAVDPQGLSTVREQCDRASKLLFGLSRATLNLPPRDVDPGSAARATRPPSAERGRP